MIKLRYRIASYFLWLANFVYPKENPGYFPHFRAVDSGIEGIGHKFAAACYSYEHLKSLVEQDGPEGFGATATIKWLIGEEGWVSTEDIEPKELQRLLAVNGIETQFVEPDTGREGTAV